MLIRRRRSVSDKELPAEQRKRKNRSRSSTWVKSASLQRAACAPSYPDWAISHCSPCRSFASRQSVGALTIYRRETGSFVPEIVSLLKTFATQSVLAIQNARLFREIEDEGQADLKSRASISRNFSLTCRTSCARRSTRSSASRKF